MVAVALAVWILLASMITAILYLWDKRAAIKDRRRVSENTLLVWSTLGGWPGAIAAGRLARHKTLKSSYRLRLVLAVMINILLIGAVTRHLSTVADNPGDTSEASPGVGE